MRVLNDDVKKEVIEDFNRARSALVSAKRNFDEGDILTSANRIFVACENATYALMRLRFGNTTFSRKRITIGIKRINPLLVDLYEQSYDMRVQADYGRRSRIAELTKERVHEITRKIEKLVSDIESELRSAGIFV